MKHLIIVKWKNPTGISLEDIREIFDGTLSIQGVHSIRLIPGIKSAPNRFDLIISMDMDQAALESYNASDSHKEWKAKYSSLMEAKAIFDFQGEI